MALDRWNGSVWVVIAVGTNPMCRVAGATRAAISTASRRPRTRGAGVGLEAVVGLQVQPSSIVRKRALTWAVSGLADGIRRIADGE